MVAVPSVCPVALSSAQTRSPVINPSVYCPTSLRAGLWSARLAQVWLSRWTPAQVSWKSVQGVSGLKGNTCWPGISAELCRCLVSPRCAGRRAAISFRAAERIWKSFCWGKRITPAKPSYASVTALFGFCKPHIDLSVKNNCIVKSSKMNTLFYYLYEFILQLFKV